jgi:hypothetical protein
MTTAMMPEMGSSPVGVGYRSVPPPLFERGRGGWFVSSHSVVVVAGAPQYMQSIGGRAGFRRWTISSGMRDFLGGGTCPTAM